MPVPIGTIRLACPRKEPGRSVRCRDQQNGSAGRSNLAAYQAHRAGFEFGRRQESKKKSRPERSTRPSNRLPAPNGLGFRFRRPSRNLLELGNDLFRPESQGTHVLSRGIQGQAEAVVVRAVRRVVRVAVRRPAIRRVVVPTAATVHAVRALRDRPPPMVVTQTSEFANSSPQPLSQTPSGPLVAPATPVQKSDLIALLVRALEPECASAACSSHSIPHASAKSDNPGN